MVDLTINKWMKKNVALATRDETVMKAANEMVDKGIGSLIVVEEGKPVGIITETDIVRKVVASGVSSKLITVEDIMTKNVQSIDADEDITEASELMDDKHIKRLPVVENGKVVGMLTSTDIVKAMAKLAH